MDTRADFQRLLEDMDKAVQTKRQELAELDERLESQRGQLSEREAQELLRDQPDLSMTDALSNVAEPDKRRQIMLMMKGGGTANPVALVDEYLEEQSKLYEQQLERFGEELSEFETINQEIVGENEKLKRQLVNCLEELEQSKVNSILIRENVEELQSANLELNLRLARAESELQTNKKLLKTTNQQDEVLMYAFNDKLETLKRAIEERDDEIKRLKLDNQFTLETFVELGSNSEVSGIDDNNNNDDAQLIELGKRKQVIEIARAFREKDEQINLLKSQLLQATNDLEQNANLLEMMKKHYQTTAVTPITSIESDRDESNLLDDLVRKLEMVEKELEVKDSQLHLSEFRIHHYETILPNMISDLVRKLATTSAQLLPTTDDNDDVDERSSPFVLKRKATAAASETIEKVNRLQMDSIKSLMEKLAASLSRLPGELSAARALLDNIDQLRGSNEMKEARIERLVNELNQLDVKFNLVQQQCDLMQQSAQSTPQSKSRTDLPTATRSLDLSRAQQQQQQQQQLQPQIAACDTLNSPQNVNSHLFQRPTVGQNRLMAAGECRVADKSLQAASNARSVISQASDDERRPIQVAATAPKLPATPGEPPARATKVRFEQPDEGHQSVSESGKRSISGKQQVAALNGTAALALGELRQQQQVHTAANSRDGSVEIVQSQSNKASSSGSDVAGDQRENSKMVASQTRRQNNGQLRDESVQQRLGQLEKENELLELAMKEILLSIKWSDAQCSTILIDCPSLERLCQLIEARFLAKVAAGGGVQSGTINGQLASPDGQTNRSSDNHLFQLVVLKSELDLLRGQNEQLRADIKMRRRDYQELLRLSARNHLEQQKSVENVELETTDERQTDAAQETLVVGSLKDDKDRGQTNQSLRAISESVVEPPDKQQSDAASGLIVRAEPQTGDKQEAPAGKGIEGEQRLAIGDRCSNCGRLRKLTNHLLQCIIRLETRVNMNEETFIGRLLNLRQLIQLLESLLNEAQRERHLMAKQKALSETRLQFVETELSFHLRICPMLLNTGANNLFNSNNPSISQLSTYNGKQLAPSSEPVFVNGLNRLQVYTSTTAQSALGESIQSLTSISGGQNQQVTHLPTMRSARLTITLLQSIIGCLQARLDYKDERLRNLEALITSSNQIGSNRSARREEEMPSSSMGVS